MYIAHILYPVKTLGPGNRIGIWFCGCPHHCKGCITPELWETNERYRVSLEQVMHLVKEIVKQHKVDGFTVSGGEPFFQKEDLENLLEQLIEIHPDILVYTGFVREELEESSLENIAVLIDGRYIEECNTGCRLRGSDNQRIWFLKEEYRQKYENYMRKTKNEIQVFMLSDGTLSVGIHEKTRKER